MKNFGVLIFLIFFATPDFTQGKTDISIFCYECSIQLGQDRSKCPHDDLILNCTFPQHRTPFCYKKEQRDAVTQETSQLTTRGCGLRIYQHITPGSCQRRGLMYVWPCDHDKCNGAEAKFSFGAMLILIKSTIISTWVGLNYL